MNLKHAYPMFMLKYILDRCVAFFREMSKMMSSRRVTKSWIATIRKSTVKYRGVINNIQIYMTTIFDTHDGTHKFHKPK